jgi:hypothetical protein
LTYMPSDNQFFSRCLRHRLHHVRVRSTSIWFTGLKFSDRDLPMILYMIRKRGFLTGIGRIHYYQGSYAATRGLFFSHMGWIFYKPNYERMELIERDDLDNDPGL